MAISNEQLYRLVFNQSQKIIANQHDIMTLLDALIQKNGEEQALEVKAIHDRLVKQQEENRQLEYENFLLKRENRHKDGTI